RLISLQSHRRLLLASSLLAANAQAFFAPRSAAPSSIYTSSNRSMSTNNAIIVPPIPRREENRTVYAGKLPNSYLLRQSNDSTEPLLSPPISIPDPYGWLRDDTRSNPEILSHLQKENEYSSMLTAHLKPFQERLYQEFLNSIQETDYTTPRPHGDYWYYTRTYEGLSYSTYVRAPKYNAEYDSSKWDGGKDTKVLEGEVTYLDVNALAANREYCHVGGVSISPSHRYVAYSVDYVGDEVYELHVRDLESGEDVVLEKINDNDTSYDENGGADTSKLEIDDFVWGSDDNTLYYVTMDEQHRPYRLYQRTSWKNSPIDTLLKEELDDLYWCSVSKSLDEKYIFFEMASKETSEVWFLPITETSSEEMKCVAPRRNKVLYEVEHGKGQWFIVTNVDNSPNMKLMSSPAVENSSTQWKLVTDASDQTIFDGSVSKALDSVSVFDTHLALEGREGGIPRIWLYDIESKTNTRLEFEESAYDVGLGAHYESNAKSIVVSYNSMVTPPSSIEIPLDGSDERKVLKAKSVPGYNKDVFGCDRIEVLSRDGKTRIPVSIVFKKDTMEKVKSGETVPLHLYGYGSYGACMEADFDITRLPLLDRGMIYAIAHIRGGGEMGRQWYEEPNGAKYLCKKNTFNDFVDVAKYLVDEKWTSPDKMSCEGRSAGGLLIGAVLNQAPELFRAAILGVPFVDVVVTMTDSSIPLTSGEWVEWGNPNEAKFYKYMMEYSPMNSIQKDKTYPACWITGGLHDPRVAYWEPAKYAATIRHLNPNNPHPICLKLDLTVGHFSASDRYKYFREMSIDYSFLLDQLKLA
ncbi:hypothetical protein ACHAXN_005411, partial [Cyclotella atomus]